MNFFISLIFLIFCIQFNINSADLTAKQRSALFEKVKKFEEYSFSTGRNARLLLLAIEQFDPLAEDDPFDDNPDFISIITLFESAEKKSPAYKYLQSKGLALLNKIYEKLIKANPSSEYADKIMTIVDLGISFQQPLAYSRFTKNMKAKSLISSYVWNSIYPKLIKKHPFRKKFLDDLTQGIFPEDIAASILYSANGLLLDKQIKYHPFDNEGGGKLLKSWVQSKDPEKIFHAYGVAVACAFLKHIKKTELLRLAANHHDMSVSIEAGWAAIISNIPGGLQVLQKACLNVNYSITAQRYLHELKLQKAIPKASKEGDFNSKAKFADWLSHPNELGEFPDELRIEDKRMIKWHQEEKKRMFRIVSYRLKDKTGLEEDDIDATVMGNTTFCLFGYSLHRRPPEDVYAIHCVWENSDSFQEVVIKKDLSKKFLKQWQGANLKAVTFTKVYKIANDLQYPQESVAVAKVRLKDQPGYVVFDGKRSQWYPANEQPKEDSHLVLKLHIGRVLLGFGLQETRRSEYLKKNEIKKDPAKFIKNYEKYLTNLNTFDQESTLDIFRLLGNHLEQYATCKSKQQGTSSDEIFIRLFMKLVQSAEKLPRNLKDKIFSVHYALGKNLKFCVGVLNKSKNKVDSLKLIKLFSPYFEHNLGYGILGKLAYDIGDFKLSKMYLTKLRNIPHWHNNENILLLVKMWIKEGKSDQAIKLYTDLLALEQKDISETIYLSDRNNASTHYWQYIESFKQHFPKECKKYQQQSPLSKLKYLPLKDD